MIAFFLGFVTAVCFVTATNTNNSEIGRWSTRGYLVGMMSTAFVVCGGI